MKLFLIACLATALASFSVARSTAQSTTQSTIKLNLQFPQELSVGRLILLKPDWKANGHSATGSPFAEARGSVKTLSGQSIMLLGNDCISERMNLLAVLPPNALACLVLSSTSIADKDLAFVGNLTGLRRLEFEDTDITDAGLVHLSKLANLEYLSLSCTLIKGNTLDHLNAAHLKNLHLENVALEPKAFRSISKFKELRWLSLTRAHLSDTALVELATLPKLEGLIIPENPNVTDAGVRKLAAMKQLRRVDLANTSVTLAGVLALKEISLKWLRLSSRHKSDRSCAQLQSAFPRATIVFDKDHQRIPSEMFAPLH